MMAFHDDPAVATLTPMTLAEMPARMGERRHWSSWLTLDQATIDAFAATTGDTAFIHTDPERAGRTRFAGTIAHGLLTLSLLPMLLRQVIPRPSDTGLGVNYGFDRLRFVAPVPVGSHVRAGFRLLGVSEAKPRFFHVRYDVEVVVQGEDRPALVAEWILAHWLQGV